MIWRGKVGTRDSGACNVTGPVTSVPIASIYCTPYRLEMIDFARAHFARLTCGYLVKVILEVLADKTGLAV